MSAVKFSPYFPTVCAKANKQSWTPAKPRRTVTLHDGSVYVLHANPMYPGKLCIRLGHKDVHGKLNFEFVRPPASNTKKGTGMVKAIYLNNESTQRRGGGVPGRPPTNYCAPKDINGTHYCPNYITGTGSRVSCKESC